MGWVEFQSRDVNRSRDFYEALFGWNAEEGTRGYLVFTRSGEPICGLMAAPDDVPTEVPSHWLVYFVADVARAVELPRDWAEPSSTPLTTSTRVSRPSTGGSPAASVRTRPPWPSPSRSS